MRWSIIRTIWFREMRDQLRDRRTLLVILGLPLILYPLLGFAVVRVAVEFTEKPSVIGVVTGSPDVKDFPPREPPSAGRSVVPVMAWLSATPLPADGVTQGLGACAFANASGQQFDYPLFIAGGQLGQGRDSNAPLRLVFLHDVE